MREYPNLSYIKQLSGGDTAFEKRLMDVVRRELPEEKNTYQKNISSGNFIEAAGNVHKLKHKISILGLEKSYHFAETYEEELRKNDNSRQKEFEDILQRMSSFIEES